MGIRVKHEADPEIIGRLALATGEGTYNKWLYEQQQQERMQQNALIAQQERQREALEADRERRAFEADLQQRSKGIDFDRANAEYDRRQGLEQDQWRERQDVERETWNDKQKYWEGENNRRAQRDAELRGDRDALNNDEKLKRDREHQLAEDLENGAYTPDQAKRIQQLQFQMNTLRRSDSVDEQQRSVAMSELQRKLDSEIANRMYKPKRSEEPVVFTDPDSGERFLQTATGWSPIKKEKVTPEKPEITPTEYMRLMKQARADLTKIDENQNEILPDDAAVMQHVDEIINKYSTNYGRKRGAPTTGEPPLPAGAAPADDLLKEWTPEKEAQYVPKLQTITAEQWTPERLELAKKAINEARAQGVTGVQLIAIGARAAGVL